MLLFSLTHLIITFVYSWVNIWSLGYLGVFMLVFLNLFLSIFLVWWELYYMWFYDITYNYLNFLWAELGNNMFIFTGVSGDFFGILLSFIMLSGGFFVMLFVFIDLWEDKEGVSFLINLGLFLIFMMIVANADNLIFFYLGWEGMGLMSLFLINFWGERVRGLKASFKVFVINKFGDFFILILICLLLGYIGEVDFYNIQYLNMNYLNFYLVMGSLEISFMELCGIFLVLGGSMKSAQYGFHIWLLEAMEAPLGASALMHSSTLVVAGLVLIYRLSIFLELSTYAQMLMFLMGVFSAFAGSVMACFQYELKVIMAYSTISNMGYMFALCSLGAYFETTVLMTLHAYMKIFLFLVMGGMILHCNGCQDVSWMGGLLLYMPALWVAYVVGGVCLVGLPYWSGYFCKYFICSSVFNSSLLVSGGDYILLFSYFFTGIYVFSLGYLVFFNSKNGHSRMYRLKPMSFFYLYDLILLGLVILFGGVFWVNLIDANIIAVNSSAYMKTMFFFKYIYYDIPLLALIGWLFIYLILYMLIFFWVLFNLNLKWNILQYWWMNLLIIVISYFYFII